MIRNYEYGMQSHVMCVRNLWAISKVQYDRKKTNICNISIFLYHKRTPWDHVRPAVTVFPGHRARGKGINPVHPSSKFLFTSYIRHEIRVYTTSRCPAFCFLIWEMLLPSG